MLNTLNNQLQDKKLPYLGYGLGLRAEHYQEILLSKPKVDWFEIISEDYMINGGKPRYYLEKIRQDFPIVMHGVSMSIASAEPLNWEYLRQLKELIAWLEPSWISDHLCWTGVNGYNTHDLLPVPYTKEIIEHIAERIIQVQEYLGRRILLENISQYIYYKDQMPEWEFISQLVNKADCLLLLDVNNVFVNAFNHQFEAKDYIKNIPFDRVQQIHLAGHDKVADDLIIDTHDSEIIPEVLELYKYTVDLGGKISTMIERDANIPPFHILLEELEYVRNI